MNLESKAQAVISNLLKELDQSQAIIPGQVGTECQDTQTVPTKTRRIKYNAKRHNETNEAQNANEGNESSSKGQRQNANEEREVTPNKTDLIEELKKQNKIQKEYRKAIESQVNKNILWQPHPGPQTEFLASYEYEVGFFGGRGPLAYGEKIITPTGPVNVQDIKIGDVVCTPCGSTATVIDIPFDGVSPCAELTFSDGRKVISTIDHRWVGRTPKGKSGYQRKDRVVLTQEFINGGQVPLTTPVHHDTHNVLLDPYMMGLMLGDGHINTHISLTSWDSEIISYCNSLYNDATIYRDGKEIRFTRHSRRQLETIFDYYGLLGCLSNNKYIPTEYLYNSVDTRVAILQGLMDTDGYASGAGQAEFTSVSKVLAEGVQQLVWSLGGRATMSTKVGAYTKDNVKHTCQDVYRLYITLDTICPFRLQRKVSTYNQKKQYNRKNYLTVVGYKELGDLAARCITVDHPNHQILTSNYVVTLNSGKSDCLLVDPLRFVDHEEFKGLIIRKTMPALREIISRAKRLYPKIKPGTKWREAEKLFEFPSGATIEFGYYDHIDDYDRYHGREFAWLGIDEITQFHSQEYYDRIKSVVRSSNPNLSPRIRCTCNPSGPGRIWVKEYFEIEPGTKIKSIDQTFDIGNTGVKFTISKKYIIATVFDNPSAVDNDPQYIAFLQSLPPAQRKQWLEGDFEAVDGLAFEEFDRNVHIIEPFDIPHSWLRIRGIDWGYRGKAVCEWIAFDKDGTAYVYRELVTSKVHSDTFARMVLDLEEGEYVSYGVVDGQAGLQSGSTGPTAEEDFLNQGLCNQHADKRAGSRIHTKQMIHKYLRIDPETGQPKIKFFNTCKQIINELGSLMVDPNNSEDINQKQSDDAYDALKYALSSRPDPEYGGGDYWDSYKRYESTKPVIVNSKFGY